MLSNYYKMHFLKWTTGNASFIIIAMMFQTLTCKILSPPDPSPTPPRPHCRFSRAKETIPYKLTNIL